VGLGKAPAPLGVDADGVIITGIVGPVVVWPVVGAAVAGTVVMFGRGVTLVPPEPTRPLVRIAPPIETMSKATPPPHPRMNITTIRSGNQRRMTARHKGGKEPHGGALALPPPGPAAKARGSATTTRPWGMSTPVTLFQCAASVALLDKAPIAMTVPVTDSGCGDPP
jgi:hypothetical protein